MYIRKTNNMKKLNKQQEKEFKQVNDNVAKILIYSMQEFDIPNFIEFTSVSGQYRYKLRFDKGKI